MCSNPNQRESKGETMFAWLFDLTPTERRTMGACFGGWIAGALSDRLGRVRVLQITVAWYAFFTFLCGFAQDFNQLFVFRALQGLGFGGEWAAGAVLIGEVIR